MTDVVKIALIGAAVSLAPTVVGVFNNVLARRTAKHVEEMKAAVVEASAKVENIEKHTNSMHDAIVTLTGEKEFDRGLDKGLQAGVKAVMPKPDEKKEGAV